MPTPVPAPPAPHPPTSHAEIDQALVTLNANAPAWAALPLADRIAYLRGLLAGTFAVAPALVADICAAKGFGPLQAGEEWVASVVSMLRTMRILLHTLEGIQRNGRVPLPESAVRVRPDGQVTVRVVPTNAYDRLLFFGVKAHLWADRAVDRGSLDAHMGGFYTKPETVRPGTSLVLGAGNVVGIGWLDAVHKLFVEGRTVLIKFSRVAEYMGPHFERAFADLIAAGFVRTAYGGRADNGDYLTRHPRVSDLHLTGSGASYDAIVWGPDAAARKVAGSPIIDKPVTCELGNVSPVILVPGRWSSRALRLRAEDVATQITHNSGYNCNAARVVVLPEKWPQREEFMDRLRGALRSLPLRPAYYPGAEETYDRYLASHDRVETFGARSAGVLPTALLVGLDPEGDHLIFREEPWCPLAATTLLPGDTPAQYLARAVSFCNERLTGTLDATMIVDGDTERDLGPAYDAAVAGLHYGAVAVNIWSAAAFVFGSTPWGGYPGHTPQEIGSGVGFVHNARLLDRIEKGVIHAPFPLFPKPPWFVTHRYGDRVIKRIAGLEADPHWWRLPGIAWWAALG
jgi:acyl-CoA reductase-like NAD-dependent aldehyde dehydrogenase